MNLKTVIRLSIGVIMRKILRFRMLFSSLDKELIVFLHFKKAAGSFIVKNFLNNGFKLHNPNKNGNPYNKRGEEVEFWNYSKKEFDRWINKIKKNRVNFIACEWNFFKPPIDNYSGIHLITCLRDPYNRLISNYKFDVMNYGKSNYKYKNIKNYVNNAVEPARSFTFNKPNYYIRMPNYYIRMLCGLGDKPDEIITENHLEYAKKVLEKFHTIVILEIPESFNLLKRYLYTISKNKINKSHGKVNIPPDFKKLFIKENKLDYELYNYAKSLCENMIKSRV